MDGLELTAKLYSRLDYEKRTYFMEGQLASFPKSTKLLRQFLSGYLNHAYEFTYYDFYDVTTAPDHVKNTLPRDKDTYSIVLIGRRPKSKVPGKLMYRPVRVHINTGVTNSGEPLNRCWRRFCGLKEVCQALIYEEIEKEDASSYPHTISFRQVDALFNKIDTEPFSLWDFDDPDYDSGVRIENMAELLAAGLLFPFEHIVALQDKVATQYGSDFSKVDTLAIADYYKIPQRYVKVLMTWSALPAFILQVEAFKNSLD